MQKNAAVTSEVAEAFGLTTMTSRKWHVQASIATRCGSVGRAAVSFQPFSREFRSFINRQSTKRMNLARALSLTVCVDGLEYTRWFFSAAQFPMLTVLKARPHALCATVST